MRANILSMLAIMLALISCSATNAKSKDEKEESSQKQALAGVPEHPGFPSWEPDKPRTQSAKCAGIDGNDRPQFLTLESRWVPDGLIGRTVLSVLEDSTGILKRGTWLENASSRSNDRKYGIGTSDWNGLFVKPVGEKKARIQLREHYYDSATVTYVNGSAIRDEEDLGGSLLLVGRCRLFVEDEPRSPENRPRTILPR